MKKLTILFCLLPFLGFSQTLQNVDILLIEGEYEKAALSGELLLKKDSTNADLHYKIGLAYQSLNEYKKSNFFLRKASKLDTTVLKYKNAHANSLQIIGYHKKAILHFLKVLEKDPDNFYALDKIAKLYIKVKLYNKASTTYNILSRLYPKNPYYLRQIGYCYVKQKAGGFALQYYQEAYDLDSTNFKSIRQLASFWLRASKYDKCLQIAKQGILVDSTNSEFHRLKGMAHFSKNHNFLAIPEFLKCIELGDSTLEIVKFTGIAYHIARKHNKAYDYLISAYDQDSISDYTIPLYLARNYLALDSFTLSIDFFEKTLKILTPSKYIMYNIYRDMAVSYAGNNEYNKALEMYNEKHKEFGGNYVRSSDYYSMALLYDKLQNSGKAIEYFNIYLKKVKGETFGKSEKARFDYAESRRNRLREEAHMKQ